MFVLDTLSPYKELDRKGIQYSVCREYDHVSQHRTLRQVVHGVEETLDRFVALETPNQIKSSNLDFQYHEVEPKEENRLDVLAYNLLGSASYAWAIAYFNGIQDGYTVKPGQKIKAPKNISSLMTQGNILQPVTALQLNLGFEE